MNSFNSDSLEDSSCESKLQGELKLKDKVIKDKELIIASLRSQVEDFKSEVEELENKEQLLRRDLDRVHKQIEEKDQELEAISRYSKELETANDNLNKKYSLRTEQMSKIFHDLSQTKKQLEAYRSSTEGNDVLKAQFESKELALKTKIREIKQELDVTETSLKLEQQHKERYARENLNLERKIVELSKEIKELKEKQKLSATSGATASMHFSMADEIGEFMDTSSVVNNKFNGRRALTNIQKQQSQLQSQQFSPLPLQQQPLTNATNDNSNYCQNHRIKKSQFFHSDPIAEEKMRLERMNELARRNKLTKPLHQTSYALELETFDEYANEIDIKRGNVNRERKALADFSNNQPVRKPVKKAEAFIVS